MAQIEATYDWLSSLEDEDEIAALIETFSEAQPVLFVYLMTMGEGDFDADENELLLFLGYIIWQSHHRAGHEIPPIAEAHLDEIQAYNVQMLEYLAEEGESGFEQVARSLMEESPQPQLLRFLVEIIFEEEADIIRPRNQGIMFIFLKVVADAIEASRTG